MIEDEKTGALNAVTGETNDAEDTTLGALPGATIGTIRDKMAKYSELGKQQQDFYERMAERLAAQRMGPTASERLFQLSAAFAQPTTTRGFGGVMANIMPVLQQQQQERRVGEIKRQEALEALTAQQLAAKKELLGQELTTELKLGELERKASAPKMPKTVGTEVVNGKIVVITQDPDTGKVGTTEIGEAPQGLKLVPGATSGGQPVFQDPSGNFMTADRQPVSTFDKKEKPLSSTEMREIFQTESAVNTGLSTIRSLEEALTLNDQAYEGSLSGWRKTLGQLTSSDDPRYVATENFDNLQISSAIGNLKNIFPGAISNDERKAFNDLQAVSKYPREVRAQIIRRGMAAAKSLIARETGKLERLKSGEYSTRGGSTTGSRVIRYDKQGNRI